MDLVKTWPELQAIANHRPIIAATAGQLSKDFGTFGVRLYTDSIPETWEELFNGLRPEVARLAREEEKKLVQVFYRIDLSERLLRDCLSKQAFETATDEITALLIQRELKKVVYRMHYRSQSGHNPALPDK